MFRRIFNRSVYQYLDFNMTRYHWLKGISYEKQYETRDFLSKKHIIQPTVKPTIEQSIQPAIINYCDTEAFRNYKPNLKQ